MKTITMLVIAGLIAAEGVGQQVNQKNVLSLHAGMSYLARQDLIFSPFIHRDLSWMNLGLEYQREADLFQKISLRYAGFNPMVSNPYEFEVQGEPEAALPHHLLLVDMGYLAGKKIKKTAKSTTTVGGLFTSDVQALNYLYGRISSFGYYSAFALGVFWRNELAITEKKQMTVMLQLPLLAWSARSPYLVNDDEFIENIRSHSGFKTFMAYVGDGELVSWGGLQTFDLEIRYACRVSEKWEFGTAYLFEFIHMGKPRNLLSYRHSLSLSANFRF